VRSSEEESIISDVLTMRPIYLDYNASTPIDPAVAAVMRPFLEDHYGNPSSGHWAATMARSALETARGQVAALLGCRNDEIVLTSGGSEANNLALKGVFFALRDKGDHIVTTQIEHPAIIEPCRFLHYRAGVAAAPPGAANEGHQRRQAARSSAGSPGLAPWVHAADGSAGDGQHRFFSRWPMPARRVVKSTRLDLILLRSLAQRSVLNGMRCFGGLGRCPPSRSEIAQPFCHVVKPPTVKRTMIAQKISYGLAGLRIFVLQAEDLLVYFKQRRPAMLNIPFHPR
jgi:hypothetical protein